MLAVVTFPLQLIIVKRHTLLIAAQSLMVWRLKHGPQAPKYLLGTSAYPGITDC
jgi:hypothetical protein